MTHPAPYAIAANLATMVYLARHRPDETAALDRVAEVLAAALGGQDVGAESLGSLVVAGVRVSEAAPGVRDVLDQMLAHGLTRMVIPSGTSPDDLVALARSLAAYPGAYESFKEFRRALGGAAERLHLEHAGTDPSVITLDHPVPDELILTKAAGATLDVEVEDLSVPPIEVPSSAYGPSDETPAAAQREGARHLEALVRAGRVAEEAGDVAALLEVARDMLDAADIAPSEAHARLFRMELRRLLPRRSLGDLARLAAVGQHKEAAVKVLRRLGPEATEVLMELLVETEDLTQRRSYYSALTRMAEGTDVIIHHLDHPAWYVVRNAAELCGELYLTRAVPSLARASTHADERVRRSIATALSRLATPDVLEPLARMLKDSSPAIRVHVLGNLAGSWGRALAMSVAALLETEDHPDVIREALRALGRIGTPDAVQALQRAAAGGNRRLNRDQRLQAVACLAQAGAPAG